jgi:hypothetical protein
VSWDERQWRSPAPSNVKRTFLSNRKCQLWIESGTYHGDTTHILSSTAEIVVTFEPDRALYEKAFLRFQDTNIHVIHGKSEDWLEDIIDSHLSQQRNVINFYLDGHYSGNGTYFGTGESPIVKELEVIEKFLPQLNESQIYIDDFRSFEDHFPILQSLDSTYPTKNYLVNFAKKNRLNWSVELDIFIMTKN